MRESSLAKMTWLVKWQSQDLTPECLAPPLILSSLYCAMQFLIQTSAQTSPFSETTFFISFIFFTFLKRLDPLINCQSFPDGNKAFCKYFSYSNLDKILQKEERKGNDIRAEKNKDEFKK